MQGSHCTSCGTPIPDVVVAAPFCPYCGNPKGAQSQAQAPARAPVVIQRAAAAPKAPPGPFTAPVDSLYMTFDPRAGYALIGPYAPGDEKPRLRAYDVYGKRVAWDAFTGEDAVGGLDYESIAVRSGNVYVGVGRSFRALDLMTGQQKWGAELTDLLAHESDRVRGRGACVVDPAPAGARGPVWTVVVDGTISAFDRDTGQPLWRETREDLPSRFHPYEARLLLLEYSEKVELVDPGTRKVLDTVGPRTRRFDLAGRHGLMQVHSWGWRERDGILVHDFMTKKEALFEAVENAEYEVQVVAGQNRVFCATDDGAKLFAAPHGKAVELMAGLKIRSLVMCGPTLVALLRKEHGTSYRRLLGVDPQTLTLRFDLGEWSPQPTSDWTGQVRSNGYVAVAVTSPTGNERDCELLAVDPGGRVVWKLPVGYWKWHEFLGGHLVVESSKAWRIVRPDTGQVVAIFEGSDTWSD